MLPTSVAVYVLYLQDHSFLCDEVKGREAKRNGMGRRETEDGEAKDDVEGERGNGNGERGVIEGG